MKFSLVKYQENLKQETNTNRNKKYNKRNVMFFFQYFDNNLVKQWVEYQRYILYTYLHYIIFDIVCKKVHEQYYMAVKKSK